MENYSRSVTFLDFPREIRDLIYSVVNPRDEIYAIPCVKKITLAKVVFNARPDLGILWTSKAIQHEFLETLCATNTFRFPFSRDDVLMLVPPLGPYDADLIQRVEISFDLTVDIAQVLGMFGNEIKRKTCHFTVENEYALKFPLKLINALNYMAGFETVIVLRPYSLTIDAEKLQEYSEFVLGPSSIHQIVDTTSYEFHPRDFLPNRGW